MNFLQDPGNKSLDEGMNQWQNDYDELFKKKKYYLDFDWSFSGEIACLKRKNQELMEELKTFCQSLDRRMVMKPKTKPDNARTELDEIKIGHEIDSLKKLGQIYQKEIEFLNSKLKVITGPDKVMKLIKKIQMSKERIENLQKTKKKIEKEISSNSRKLEDEKLKVENDCLKNDV